MTVFLDTGFFFGLISKKDEHHKQAQAIFRELTKGKYGISITSDFIFDESMTLINARTKGTRKDLLQKMSLLFIGTEPIAQLLKIQNIWLDEIVNLQIKITQKNNPISFTDCSNIILCRKYDIPRIVSFDDHYLQFLTLIQ